MTGRLVSGAVARVAGTGTRTRGIAFGGVSWCLESAGVDVMNRPPARMLTACALQFTGPAGPP
ncbi:hypothetical protein GCM10010359_54550 [Streptomyces morookaense]|nr:hypothetical protein GCM10010359_54550 [Streptomyces morookaense]